MADLDVLADIAAMSFEEALAELEQIVRRLEGGQVKLDEAILSYERGAEMLNFGAFIAFMGVNAAAFVRYFLRAERKTVWPVLWPLLGFGICGYIFLQLSMPAKKLGAVWVAAGLIYGAWKTSGFRKTMSFEAPVE